MPAKHRHRALPLALGALAAFLLAVPAALAAPARYEGISADGKVVVFSTVDQLVPGDTDLQRDVYVRELDEELGYVTREASLGPTGGNDSYPAQFLAIDAAGDRVFFATKERLAAADKDSAEDVYVRDLAEDTTTLVSAGDPSCAGSGCGNANVDAGAAPGGIVDEGNRVFFVSSEQLSSQDKDASPDVYVRDLEAGTTTLVSVAASSCSGSCGSGTKPSVFQDASADGSKAIFTSAESLVGTDADSESDLYERDLGSGETKLVSTAGPGPEACPAGHNCEPVNSAISAGGAHVFFETNERVVAEDSDKSQDVYDWSGGTATRVSTGAGGGNGEHNALFESSSAGGAAVFFATSESLAVEDTDEAQDVYVRQGGETELVSEGAPACQLSGCGDGELPASLAWVSAAGTTAVLSTAEPLVAEDQDSRADVYVRALPGGTTTLVSAPGPTCVDPECGNGEQNASFAGASDDGSHLFFVTDEALAPPLEGDTSGPGDRDERTDVYDRDGGTTTWVSAGQLGGSGLYSGNGAFNAQLQGVAGEGARAFLTTDERLTEADHDSEEDVYERSPTGTVLVSQGNDPDLEAKLAPPPPDLEATNPESPGASTEPEVLGSESIEASIKLYRTADCSGEPAATGSSAALESPGIEVSVAPGSTTDFRATAEAEGFISECSEPLAYRQRDPEPEGGGSGGGDSGGGTGGGSGPGLGSVPTTPHGPSPQAIPVTRITFGPVFKTRARSPVFRFTDSTGQAGTRFVCRVDRHAWKSCKSPRRLQGLTHGRHLFEVKGVNSLGEAEAKPTSRRFKLVGAGRGGRR